uniref:Uncharacterized protein n=1 Tax=Plectus sambesii TaxID=2011161 RepID=A0A914V4H8_9BILA
MPTTTPPSTTTDGSDYEENDECEDGECEDQYLEALLDKVAAEVIRCTKQDDGASCGENGVCQNGICVTAPTASPVDLVKECKRKTGKNILSATLTYNGCQIECVQKNGKKRTINMPRETLCGENDKCLHGKCLSSTSYPKCPAGYREANRQRTPCNIVCIRDEDWGIYDVVLVPFPDGIVCQRSVRYHVIRHKTINGTCQVTTKRRASTTMTISMCVPD